MKKLSLILVLSLIIGCINFGVTEASFATDKRELVASVEFGSNAAENGITMSGNITSSVSIGGQSIGKLDGDAIYIDITDSDISTETKGSAYEAEIEYYDDKEGYFVLWYDKINYGRQVAKEETDGQVVYKRGEEKLKTARFRLEEAAFKNNIDGKGDLMISLREQGIILKDKKSPLYVKSIKVYEIENNVPVYVESVTNVLGNTFSYTENKIVTNTFVNPTNQAIDINVTYELRNSNGKTYFSERDEFSIAAKGSVEKEVKIDRDRCGVYTWYVTVSNGVNTREFKEDTIAIIKTDPNGVKGNFGWIHEGLEKYTPAEAANAINLMKKGNIAGVRLEVKWKQVEKGSRGNYSLEGTEFKQNIDLCKSLGLPFYVLVYGGNTLYQTTAGIPKLSETDALNGWSGFCNWLFKYLKDNNYNVVMYEVWNEPDLPTFNPTGAEAADLAEITKRARSELNTVYGGVNQPKISGFSITGLTDPYSGRLKNWICPGIDEGIADKDKGMNVLAVHTYAPDREPEKAKIWDVIKQYQKEIGEASNATQNIPVVISEFGNSTLPESSHGRILPDTIESITTKDDKRNWITRAAILYKVNGVGDYASAHCLAEKGIFSADREDQFGMTSPIYDKYNIEGAVGIPTESYLAYAAMNYILGGEITDYEAVSEGNIYVNKFVSKKFNKNIIALWAAFDNGSATIDLGADEVTVFDMLGNEKKMYSATGSYTFDLDGSVTYVMGDFDNVKITDATQGVNDTFENYSSTNDADYPDEWEESYRYSGSSPVGKPLLESYYDGEEYKNVMHIGLKNEQEGTNYLFNTIERNSKLNVIDNTKKVVLSTDIKIVGNDPKNKDAIQMEILSDEYATDPALRATRLGFCVKKSGGEYKLMRGGENSSGSYVYDTETTGVLDAQIWHNIKLEYNPLDKQVRYYLDNNYLCTVPEASNIGHINSFGKIKLSARTSGLSTDENGNGFYVDNIQFYAEDNDIKFADMYGNVSNYKNDNKIPVGTKQIILPSTETISFKKDGMDVDCSLNENILNLDKLIVDGNYTLKIGDSTHELAADGIGMFRINNLKIKNNNAEYENIPPVGTEVEAVAAVENSTQVNQGAKFIVAEYNEDDALIKVYVDEIDAFSGCGGEKEIPFIISTGCTQIKAFVWNDMQYITPLSEFLKIN